MLRLKKYGVAVIIQANVRCGLFLCLSRKDRV